MKIANNLTELIGNTPLIKINSLNTGGDSLLLAKIESFNPGGSVKDRIALSIIETAEKQGVLTPGMTIIEATSGNTGVGLAWISAIKGYKLILVMPETMSLERRKILSAFGAKLILTKGEKGMKGAISEKDELVTKHKYFSAEQFSNSANPEIHRKTTAEEIWRDTDGKVDIVVMGVGTGGTITGVGEALKQKNPDVRIVAVEPFDSAVISGGAAGPHKIQGIGAGFLPEVLNTLTIDEIVKVSNEEAFETSRKLAKEEGILAGISSGAAMFAALKIAGRDSSKNKIIVTVLPDTGERYLSTDLFN